MDFRSFMKNKKNRSETPEEKKEQDESQHNIREKVKSYEGKSRNEIMAELAAAAEKGKRDGTLSGSDLEGFYKKAAPMLSDEQRKRMREIIEKIK